MGWNFRKSIKIGPARINLSKSGIGYSVGAGGIRYTKRAGGKKKSESSCLGSCIKGMFGLFVATVAIYLLSSYWKWILVLVALVAAGAIGYWIWTKHQARPKQLEAEQENKDPVP